MLDLFFFIKGQFQAGSESRFRILKSGYRCKIACSFGTLKEQGKRETMIMWQTLYNETMLMWLLFITKPTLNICAGLMQLSCPVMAEYSGWVVFIFINWGNCLSFSHTLYKLNLNTKLL